MADVLGGVLGLDKPATMGVITPQLHPQPTSGACECDLIRLKGLWRCLRERRRRDELIPHQCVPTSSDKCPYKKR